MTFDINKIKAVIISLAALMIAGSVTAAAVNTQGVILGDADSDGAVTISDVTTIQRMLADLPLISGVYCGRAADADGNGIVNVDDAVMIQKWVSCMETPYPIGEELPEPTTQAPTQRPTDSEGWGRDIFQP